MEKTLTEDHPETVDLEVLLAGMGGLSHSAHLDVEEALLRELIFEELLDIRPSFDSPGVKHFPVDGFRQVVARCAQRGVQIIGVEVFTRHGQLLHLEIVPGLDDSPEWCLSLLDSLRGRIDVSVCATFVPGAFWMNL